jgi:hypothetical protein
LKGGTVLKKNFIGLYCFITIIYLCFSIANAENLDFLKRFAKNSNYNDCGTAKIKIGWFSKYHIFHGSISPMCPYPKQIISLINIGGQFSLFKNYVEIHADYLSFDFSPPYKNLNSTSDTLYHRELDIAIDFYHPFTTAARIAPYIKCGPGLQAIYFQIYNFNGTISSSQEYYIGINGGIGLDYNLQICSLGPVISFGIETSIPVNSLLDLINDEEANSFFHYALNAGVLVNIGR